MKAFALLMCGLLTVLAAASMAVPQVAQAAAKPAQFVSNLAAGKKQVIVTMGTSLTADDSSTWVRQLQAEFDKQFPGLAKIQNLGRGASSTAVPAGRCGLDMVKSVVAAKPDTVFIEYGMNDCYLPYKISPDQARANLNSIIDTIRKANPNTEVILQTMNCCKDYTEKNPDWKHATNRPNLEEYYQIYRDVARERNLLLIDHYPDWLKVMNDTPARFDQLVPDRIHPNEKGTQEIILPTLRKRIGLDLVTQTGGAAIPQPTQVTDIWVVFKTHFDIGYSDLVENVRTKYRVAMMDDALKNFEADRSQPPEKQFVWTVPGWPLERVMLGPLQDPARKKLIEQAIREGKLAVHALPFTVQTESLEEEDLVRGLHYSAQVARDYGRPLPIAAKMTDVPEHCWVLPTLLANAGIKFLQIGCNEASQPVRFPQLFWWEGPDGSRVLCNYTTHYGSGITPPKGWPAKNYLAMIMTYDNHGPPTPQEVEDLRQQAARQSPGVRVHVGTLDDFTNAVLAEKPELPVVRGDTPDTWIHGIMSMPQETKIARDIHPLEPALDSLDTHLRTYGLMTTPLAPALAEAYENSLLFGEHTWGMNGAYGPRYIFCDAWKKWVADASAEPIPPDGDYSKLPNTSKRKWLKSFDDKRDYIRKTQSIVDRELHSRLNLLAASVNTEGKRIIVWNSLPWQRSGAVEIPGRPGCSIYAQDVPPNGYKT